MKWAGSRSFFVVLSMIFAAGGNVSAAGTAPNDANDLEEAAGMVDAQSASISAVMTLCEHKQPKDACDFHMADYVWHADNHGMVLAEKRVLGNAAGRALQPLIERGIDEIEKGWGQIHPIASDFQCPDYRTAKRKNLYTESLRLPHCRI